MAPDCSQTGYVPCLLLRLSDFCPCMQVLTLSVFLHRGCFAREHMNFNRRRFSSDNCHSALALRSWTGLTTSVCINTLLLPLGWSLLIAVMFYKDIKTGKWAVLCVFFFPSTLCAKVAVGKRLNLEFMSQS